MDMQQCKVIFRPEVTRDQAEAILRQHYADVKIDTYQDKREVGANLISFAVTTLPSPTPPGIERAEGVIRVETMNTWAGGKPCCQPQQGGG